MATIIDDITQSISTIPALRLTETVINLPADEDDFVAKYEANNAHLVNNLVPELNTLKTQLNTTIGQINTVADEITTAEASISPHYVAIEAVNANATNINAVNANSTNINAAVANQTNINAVALNEANINAVNANKTNIDLVALNETNINNVSTNMPKIINVDTNMPDINLVADAIVGGTLPTIIDDTTPSTLKTYSSSKIESQISTAVGSIDLSSKQDVLVSGTNIKTVNSTSILGAGNLEIKSGFNLLNMFTNSFSILESTTWTCPADGDYYIMAIGGGGSGAVKAAANAQATGGGAGGTCLHKATLSSGDILTITIGAGGAYVLSLSSNGNAGGNTTVTGAGLSLFANGGAGGVTGTGTSVLGGDGGTASGGNIANYTGGRGGNYSRTTSFQATKGVATGGGGVTLGLNDCRGGDISISFASNQSYSITTGGGGCNGRGSDVNRTTLSNDFVTNGGDMFNNVIDITNASTNFSANIPKRNKHLLSNLNSVAGMGSNSGTTSNTKHFIIPTGCAGFGGLYNTSIKLLEVIQSSTPYISPTTGGIGGSNTNGNTDDTYNALFDSTFFLVGAGSGATVAQSGSFSKLSLSGGNGAVFIMKAGE